MPSNADIPASPSARRLAEEKGIDLSAITGTGPSGKITRGDVEEAALNALSSAKPTEPAKTNAKPSLASPSARRLAEQKGIDLFSVVGSGPGGRILKTDVEAFDPTLAVDEKPSPAPQPAPAPAPTSQSVANRSDPTDAEPPFETQKLSNVRKVVAQRLTEAKQTIPHFYLSADVRLDALLDARSQLNASLQAEGIKVSVNDMLIKALARALQRVPACNTSFQDGNLLQYQRQDISVAVAGPAGLITPIVTDAGAKSLATISSQMKALAEGAREGRLQPHEYQGGTASISNLGMFGVRQFSAIINPPQAVIMAIGAGEKRPIVVGDELRIATMMTTTASFDHRAVDGATGAELVTVFKDILEKPLSFLA